MRFSPEDSRCLVLYYSIYLVACPVLIITLNRVLHRAGRVFLNDSFAGNVPLVRAIAFLLDIGFYMVSVGYVAVTYHTIWPIRDIDTAIQIAVLKIGGLLLILGIAHMFNLLVLALFRQRRVATAISTGA